MLRHTLKIGLIVAVLGFVAQEASAFGHRGWGGCGWGGCGWGGGGYGGYYGCGYGGCGYGGYGGYGYGGGYGGYGYGPGGYAPAAPATGAPPAAPNAPAPGATSMIDTSNSALLTVSVPADAKVIVNGHPTKSIGASRQYYSAGLQPGLSYSYQVRAEFVRNGKPVSEEKTVQLTAGQTTALAFSGAPNTNVAGVVAAAKR